MSLRNILDKLKHHKTLCFIAFVVIAAFGAACFTARIAEMSGIYWIGLDGEFSAHKPESDKGFFTVDVSDLTISEPLESVPMALDYAHDMQTFTESELKLYNVLSRNNGRISSADKAAIEHDIHWKEVFVNPGETLEDVIRREKIYISADDIRRVNHLKKGERPKPQIVLFVPLTHNDVPVTEKYVRKLEIEDLQFAKRSGELDVREYVVKDGDTLWSIAGKFNLEVDTLIGSNRGVLKNINFLKLGMVLRLPNQDGIFVKAKTGDSASKIASRYGSTTEAVKAANGLKSDKIAAGREIFVPGGSVVEEEPKQVKIETKKDGKVQSKTVVLDNKRKKKRDKKYADDKLDKRKGVRFRWPVMSSISSRFGWRKSPFGRRRVFHAGLDIRAPRGTPIRAAASGSVVNVGWMSGYGKTVVIVHSSGVTTLYGHCSKLIARRGTKVKQGQVIALVGSTGRSTGNHLHFEVRINGSPRNPLKYLR